ncbi:multiple inositol polyphosphate phosphatase 1 [Galendromus occidentalis]|uniref:Multiple inositol polyphosphate phosphatase 1 n=1 Tax=Galendromus occidentalis TaxID=34638 RepID=A0AAJ6QRU5_9ACAR|nr:multiple inositol polyphosphate phosphatase 1 [Galendromus occidentalis]
MVSGERGEPTLLVIRNIEGVLHVNPDLFVDENFKPGLRKRHRSNMGVCLRCCLTLSAITLLLIGGTFIYLYLRERHLGCYDPVNGRVCYSDLPEGDRYKWGGTKTDYNVTIQEHLDESVQPLDIPGCQPVLFFLFQRHTTRYPDREDIEEASIRLKKLAEDIVSREKSRLCKQDLQEFSNWVFPFVPDQDNLVAPQGNLIVAEQVARLKKRFPSIFSVERPFQSSSISVDFTSRVRSRETGYAFLKQWFTEGVFNSVIERQIRDNVNDDLLHFHRECAAKLKQKGKLVKTPPAVTSLENSSYYSSLLETLSSRLGRRVSKDDMKVMYRQCMFEMSIVGRSPWCAVFTTADLKLLEFREDLDDYHKDAYGNDMNWKQACGVAANLFESIDEVESPSYASNYTRTVLHFSHAGALKKVLAYFGIGKGPAVKWDEACEPRGWRSSKFCPFNANILFVLHRCLGTQPKMVTLLNEKLILLPGCSSKFCPLGEFRASFQREDLKCELEEICS